MRESDSMLLERALYFFLPPLHSSFSPYAQDCHELIVLLIDDDDDDDNGSEREKLTAKQDENEG
jgi:ubiquitin C-terminal hydrolase